MPTIKDALNKTVKLTVAEQESLKTMLLVLPFVKSLNILETFRSKELALQMVVYASFLWRRISQWSS